MALANTGSPKISPHLDNGLLVVTMVEFFSYLLAMSWNNKFDDSMSNGKNPTSSIINNCRLANSLMDSLLNYLNLF